MPTTAAAAKAYRQNLKANTRNRTVKDKLKKTAVRLRKALTAKKVDEARTIARDLVRLLDKAAQKRVLTRNTAARRKSRLARALRT